MKRAPLHVFSVAMLVATLAFGQEISLTKDFLTEFEADQIRLAQDPNERVPFYLQFAKLRMALIDQLLAKEELGRGAKVHDNLAEVGRIVEAVDMVIDDALLRDADISKTIPVLLNTERELLSRLMAIQEKDLDDLWRYEFVLEDAIYVLEDSIEITSEDLAARKSGLIEADGAEKAAREKTMSQARREEVQEAEQVQQKEEKEREKKRPSLLKKGESLPSQQR
ncbi:MAG: hypothetical protein O3A53_08155 [Acidobacteria bacterium]|nr:hypothetical protein [Acidobacteriota bacterium]MDA1234760.1 hypothetical protein [Acidobacteriota bacterium]